MKDFTFCLNIQVKARDEEEALEIAAEMRQQIELHSRYKTVGSIDIDNVEEL